MPATSPASQRAPIKKALDAGLEWLLNEGHAAVRDAYVSPLRALDADAVSAADKRLAARGWHMLGELWQLNDAPHSAIRAYERCLNQAPTSAEAWAEIARMWKALGRKKKAAEALAEAKARAPGHEDEIENALFWELERFKEGEPTLEAAEALTEGDAAVALAKLEGRATVNMRRWRACAYGVRGDLEAVVAEWESIARARGPVSISYADWFYLPSEAWNHGGFWAALHKIGDRLDEEGIFPIDASLDRARGFTDAQRALLGFGRRAAEAFGDVEALAAMCKWRPRWAEAKASLAACRA